MINAIVFFATLKGRLAVGAAIILALVGVRMWDVSKQRAIGAERAVANMERAADANALKAEKARKSVSDVPADRLRDAYRRD
jgi:hypothetical protein